MNRSHALTRKGRLGDPDDSFERMLRDRTTAAERFAETWRLSEEIWRLKGSDEGSPPDEPGFSRSVTRTLRR